MAKQYISPIRLFNYLGVEYKGTANIPRIKKHLIAEFDHAADGFIETDGYSYSKNDVLEEIERPDFAERLVYHQKIWDTKNILCILEDNAVNLQGLQKSFESFQNDEAFDAFFSPYFASPFNHISRHFLKEPSLYDIATWLRFQDFLLAADREEGFRSVRVFLEDSHRILKNISKENYSSFRKQIEDWIHPGWEAFLNNVPDEFYSIKLSIVIELVNLTVKLQKTKRQDSKTISSGLILLNDLPPELADTIQNNENVYNGAGVTSSKESGNYWWVVWVVIMLIRVLSSGGCN